MRVPNAVHADRPWRIHEITTDFRLEDVWDLPVAGSPDDFSRAVHVLASLDPAGSPSPAVRVLVGIRTTLGAWFGWDGADDGVGTRWPSLRDRLPADLRRAAPGPVFRALPFTSVYLIDDEWAAELANRTMHGVLHLAWVPNGDCYRARMAVYVKPNGLLGKAYMAAIRPFRYRVVYPRLMDAIARAWHAGLGLGSSR
jgi:hypothetical protein